MQKDLKIGLAVGLGLAAAAVVWVATRPSMSPEARIRQLHETRPPVASEPQTEPAQKLPSKQIEQPAVSVIPRSPEPNLPVAAEPAQRQTPPAEPNVSTAPPAVAESVVAKEPNSPQDSTVHEQTEKISTQRFYVIRRGDTLSDISKTYYGTTAKWRKIFEANKETIKNPDRLTPGQKLIIPD